MLHIKLAVPVSNLDYTAFLVQSVVMNSNLMGDKFLCNFGMKFQHLYYYRRNFCNLIGLEQWYFSLIWNTYMWKLQTFCR